MYNYIIIMYTYIYYIWLYMYVVTRERNKAKQSKCTRPNQNSEIVCIGLVSISTQTSSYLGLGWYISGPSNYGLYSLYLNIESVRLEFKPCPSSCWCTLPPCPLRSWPRPPIWRRHSCTEYEVLWNTQYMSYLILYSQHLQPYHMWNTQYMSYT